LNPSYEAAGYVFRFETRLSAVATLLERYLAPFRTEGRGDGPTYSVVGQDREAPYLVSLDGQAVSEAWTVAWVVESVLQHVYEEAIGRTSDYLVVHAAAASWEGRGLVLSAPMDSGKTTLVTGLMRAGFDYLTDEAALLELETGILHPFPKALTLEPPTIALMPELREKIPKEFSGPGRLRYFFLPDDIRPGSVGEACPVRYVILPRFERGAPTDLRPMTRGEAVVALAENTMNLPRLAGRGFRTLATAVGDAECHRLTMGDLDGAVNAVASLVREGDSTAKAVVGTRRAVAPGV
jgi:hypothetical protein